MKYQIASLLGLGILLAAACSGSEEDKRIAVVATTTQIGDFAHNIGGDRIALSVLLEPNQDAHDFAPRPSQIRRIAAADLVLTNGLGLDAFVDKAVGGGDSVVVLTAGIARRDGDDGDDGGDGGDGEASFDPHVWLDVANAKRMVASLRDALVAADAANAPAYRENAAAYLTRLAALDAEIRSEIETIPAACRKIVTNHDVFGYYAAAYGLTIVGSIIPSTSSEARASAADVAAIADRIRAEAVPAIFTETSIDPALVRQVGREADVAVVDDLYGDSLGPAGSEGETYVGMMAANTAKIAAALRQCGA